MYVFLLVFNAFVALSGFAVVLGNTAANDSGPIVLVCSTIIGVAGLVGMFVSAILIKHDRQPKQTAWPMGPGTTRRQIDA